MGKWDGASSVENFVYDAETKEPINKYLSSLSLKYAHTIVLQFQLDFAQFASNEENLQVPQTPESNEETRRFLTLESNEENMELRREYLAAPVSAQTPRWDDHFLLQIWLCMAGKRS
ncbi:hypothetical protein C1H46_030519 [Malus baccata]|uniref:Uncharacterized protein n=1 Tax=Malus baccata TaxID=106549 RepID=A0A540LBR7_MALBA|nr:hypothetical protein C1H46_030519 [Malus baccata]